MNPDWSEQERRTNRLARLCYGYLKKEKKINSLTLYNLTRLNWITGGDNNKHLLTVKKPALSVIFGEDYSAMDFKDIAIDIAIKLRRPYKDINEPVEGLTGYTNLYSAYRNSLIDWFTDNESEIKKLADDAFSDSSLKNYQDISRRIDNLSPVLKPNGDAPMHPMGTITPLIFSLAKDLKYPIINQRQNVQNMLVELGVQNSGLEEKFNAMYAVIGQGGINDAADLDVVQGSLLDFIDSIKGEARKKKMIKKSTEGQELTIKDEEDVLVIQRALSNTAKREHNKLTNRIMAYFTKGALEGKSKSCMFDVLLENYSPEDGYGLLIEVKSSNEVADFRMAIGQLIDYARQLRDDVYCAVFLPNKPDEYLCDLADAAEVMILWFDNKTLDDVIMSYAEKKTKVLLPTLE